ncbi:hypothetical protein STEG23_014118 [Scotinomys teguina]
MRKCKDREDRKQREDPAEESPALRAEVEKSMLTRNMIRHFVSMCTVQSTLCLQVHRETLERASLKAANYLPPSDKTHSTHTIIAALDLEAGYGAMNLKRDECQRKWTQSLHIPNRYEKASTEWLMPCAMPGLPYCLGCWEPLQGTTIIERTPEQPYHLQIFITKCQMQIHWDIAEFSYGEEIYL